MRRDTAHNGKYYTNPIREAIVSLNRQLMGFCFLILFIMTKEEKIKEAWAGFFNPQVNMENGWMDIRPGTYSNDEFFDRLKFNSEKHSIRPKKISGIENNKGWIKIEIESDLPKNYDIMYRIGMFLKDGTFFQNDNLFNFKTTIQCLKYNYTHYQPVTKSEPPIY